ncbi:MAG: methyltransferase domain-containing protein [Pseudonocardiaceae bacterium]
MTAALSLRQRLADELVDNGTIHHPWVRQAFADVPREVFVPRFHRPYPGNGLLDAADPLQHDEWLNQVYTDQVLVVQYISAPDMPGAGAPTSSSSQPTVMAGMLEALDLQPDHRVLEIGTGTGYHAALLCHRVGAANVTSIELDPTLVGAARDALASLGLHPTIHTGDGAAGLATAAPFDRIIATAAADHIPCAWIDQLAPGGALVVDLRGSVSGSLIRLTAAQDPEVDAVHGRFLSLPGAFMPLRTRTDRPHRDGEDWDTIVYDHRNPQRATTDINPRLVNDNPTLRFLTQLHLAGHRVRLARHTTPTAELTGRATDTSWFSTSLRPDDNGHYTVQQAGPQRLWDTVEAAHTTWTRLGKPPIEQFGVTATDDVNHQYVWYDHPDSGYRWPLPL